MADFGFTNEKGNVSAKVRTAIHEQVKKKVLSALTEAGLAIEENVNGGLSISVGTDTRTSETVYAHLDFRLNMTDPTVKIEKKKTTKKKTETEEVEVPELFK